jgi:hypothetical protein
VFGVLRLGVFGVLRLGVLGVLRLGVFGTLRYAIGVEGSPFAPQPPLLLRSEATGAGAGAGVLGAAGPLRVEGVYDDGAYED